MSEVSFLGSSHTNLPVRGNNETSVPLVNLFGCSYLTQPLDELSARRLPEAKQEQSMMCSGGEASNVGEIQVLSNEEPPCFLRRAPDVRIAVPG